MSNEPSFVGLVHLCDRFLSANHCFPHTFNLNLYVISTALSGVMITLIRIFNLLSLLSGFTTLHRLNLIYAGCLSEEQSNYC